MLYNVIGDGDSVSYVPTTLGNILLVLVFIAFLAVAALFAKKKAAPSKSSTKLTVKQMAFCAISIALGTVLSYIKLFEFPFGGSVTLLSMLIICLPGYWFGLGAGLMTGFAHGILQLIIDPFVIHPVQLLMDYPLAFGSLGLSGLFSNSKNGLQKGLIAGVTGRWLFSSLSGYLFFKEYAWDGWHPLPYTFTYNGIYIFTETAVTLILLAIPYVRNTFARIKRLALESQ